VKILIACEFSGIVRDAFIKKGHDAISCDLLKSETKGPHYTGDIRDIIDDHWDMMVAFPPCTHLAVSGAAWFEQKRKDGRQQQGIDFFMALANANIPKIAIENPVGIMSTEWRKPDQIIQPFWFGDSFKKKTCLWLKNLPLLKTTNIVDEGEQIKYASGKSMPKWYADAYRLPPKERAKIRSKTFPGIANAMADQWG
jgi:hypothetical protein